jgi:hypothetical protein
MVNASMIRVGGVVRIDPRRSRLARARTVIRLSFGDGTQRLRVRRLRPVRHRYRKRGRFAITLTLRAHGHVWRATKRVTVGSRVVQATPAARTIVADAEVASVSGNPETTQTVMLRPGARAPRVGGFLAVDVDARHPEGVLGRVSASRRRADGATVLQLVPATLDEAYRDVHVVSSGHFTDPGVLIVDATGHVSQAASLMGAGASKFTLHFGGAGTRCTGGINGPLNIDVDLSPLGWQLDFDLRNPFIHFLVAGSPKLTVGVGFGAKGECHLTLPIHFVVPIPGTPLELKVSPRLELHADGGLGLQLTWTPRMAFGFDRGNGISQNVHAFNADQTNLALHADAAAGLLFGPSVDLSLGGRVGVSADIGPDFEATLTQSPGSSCIDGDRAWKISADAHADVFIKHWSFSLFSLTLDKQPFFHGCTAEPKPTPTPTPFATSTPSPNGGDGGGGPGDSPTTDPPTTLPDARVGYLYQVRFKQTPISIEDGTARGLPEGLRLVHNGFVVGIPRAAGTFAFDATWKEGMTTHTGTLSLTVKDDSTAPTGVVPHLGIVPASWISQLKRSPDGRYIAASMGFPEVVTLYDTVTATLSALTAGSSRSGIGYGGSEDSLSWSPDGRYLAFTSTEPLLGPTVNGPWYNIYVYDTQERRLLRITDGSGGDSYNATWSPDGELLAFRHGQSVSVLNFETGHTVDLPCPSVGTGCRTINAADEDSTEPWSADSRYLTYFVQGADYYQLTGVLAWDRATGSTHPLAGQVLGASLSQDGRRLLASDGRIATVVDVASGAALQSWSTDFYLESSRLEEHSVWSADSRFIAGFRCPPPFDPCGPAILDISNGNVTQAPAGGEFEGWKDDTPIWCTYAPDMSALDCAGLDALTGQPFTRRVATPHVLAVNRTGYYAETVAGDFDFDAVAFRAW